MAIFEVIKYEGDNSTFVWKHPKEDFNTGSQLIVHESQEALFFANGQALDLFGPGRHTLDTQNLPLLRRVVNLPTGGDPAFHCEVYFINRTEQMAVKWGTDNEAELLKEKKTFLWDIDERSLDSVAEYQAALQFASAEEKEHYEAINKELIAARPLFNDKLVPAAAELVVEMGQVSVSMLQRRLKLGYERASMLVDEMEELGIVGPLPSSGLRPVLVDEEGLAQILGQSFNKE